MPEARTVDDIQLGTTAFSAQGPGFCSISRDDDVRTVSRQPMTVLVDPRHAELRPLVKSTPTTVTEMP